MAMGGGGGEKTLPFLARVDLSLKFFFLLYSPPKTPGILPPPWVYKRERGGGGQKSCHFWQWLIYPYNLLSLLTAALKPYLSRRHIAHSFLFSANSYIYIKKFFLNQANSHESIKKVFLRLQWMGGREADGVVYNSMKHNLKSQNLKGASQCQLKNRVQAERLNGLRL